MQFFYYITLQASQSLRQSGEQHLPIIVRTLINQFLKPKTNIVLLAIPMHSDIETYQARQLVNIANAQDRTVGVLTKPDRMELDSAFNA